MTVLNQASDGLYPEVIVLARASALAGELTADDLLGACATDNSVRLRGALSRWNALGLFHEANGKISIAAPYIRGRNETIDDWTSRLPHMCRSISLKEPNCLPLWGSEEGLSADLARGLAWLLSQNIFMLPRAWNEIELLASTQVRGAALIQNDTRWNGLRFWARYLGFASGDSRSFFVDPTEAVRHEIGTFLKDGDSLDAFTFMEALAQRIPVTDGGAYRREVESRMDDTNWKKPADGHLSMSLSFAIRRLSLEGALIFESKSDAQRAFTLTGKDHASSMAFTHVRARKAAKK
jgi:hypothetical protein